MVIMVYAERRATAVGDIATHLARALALRSAPSTVAFLAADDEPEDLGDVFVESIASSSGPEAVSARLGSLGARHAAVVVAIAGPLSEGLLAVCDASDRVLLVSDPSVPSLRGTQRALKLCRSLGYDDAKLAIVLHGFSDDAQLSVVDAATFFKRDIYWQLPDQNAPAAERAESFAGLAQKLAP